MERLSLLFFSNEGRERPNIHVDKGGNGVKFWLAPVRVVRNFGFGQSDLSAIERKVREQEATFVEKWNDYFGSRQR